MPTSHGNISLKAKPRTIMGITTTLNQPTGKPSHLNRPPTSPSQLSLSLAILLSSILTYLVVTPPNPNTANDTPSTGDFVRRYGFTGHAFSIHLGPLLFLALGVYSSALAYYHPYIPPTLLRHGAANGFNPGLVTWSYRTAIPLVFLLGVGIPLRLAAFSHLGENFTFGLAEPDRLVKGGGYRWVQHPSYTGLVVTVVAHAVSTYRVDGAVSCLVAPRWFGVFRRVERLVVSVIPPSPRTKDILKWGVNADIWNRCRFGWRWWC